ncbi:twin-arginine translocase TatA/TatE family subunit [Lancefieldella parvula]|uniref:Sec-independent protein translocase subunit TatA/TatB n=1 Tax=Lancefieldella parvula TaxID=1382 RepID=UPI0028D5F252|nr:twin-arginine translocase TatA/TatE family subunit [Lancefieldella parvula]
MFGIGETELVLILLFAFLVFGPDKLPGMGRTLGRALRQFQNAQEGFNKVVRADLLDPAADALHEKPKRSEQLKNAASDADREDTDHQETFAERRARLKEEREAAEKAAAEAAEQSKQAEQTQEAEQPETASAEEAPAAPQATSSVAFSDDSTEVTEYVAPQAAEETPAAAPSAKDLYNLGSARSSRSIAEDKKEEVAGEEGESQDA